MVYPIIYRVSTIHIIQGDAGFLWISSIHSITVVSVWSHSFVAEDLQDRLIGVHQEHWNKGQPVGAGQSGHVWACTQLQFLDEGVYLEYFAKKNHVEHLKKICSNHDLSLTATLHETSWSNHEALSVLSVNSSRWQRLDMASRPCPAASDAYCASPCCRNMWRSWVVNSIRMWPRSLKCRRGQGVWGLKKERIAAQRRWCPQLLGTWNHIRCLDGCWECWNMLKYTFQLSAVHFVWGAQSAWCVQLHQKNWTVLHSSATGHFWVDAFL